MRALFEISTIAFLIFVAITFERFSAEKDFTKQLTNNGRTNFIFKDDLIVDNVRIINSSK